MAELRKEDLWVMADKLRNNMDSAEYKHVCLGLIFLKYISDSFERAYQEISQDEYADPEDRDEYLAKNVFWVPQEARANFPRKYSYTEPKVSLFLSFPISSSDNKSTNSPKDCLSKDALAKSLGSTPRREEFSFSITYMALSIT